MQSNAIFTEKERAEQRKEYIKNVFKVKKQKISILTADHFDLFSCLFHIEARRREEFGEREEKINNEIISSMPLIFSYIMVTSFTSDSDSHKGKQNS